VQDPCCAFLGSTIGNLEPPARASLYRNVADMRTEVSAKFRPSGIRAELAGAGFRTLKFWTDPDGDFGLTLAELAGPQDGRFRRVLPRFGETRRARLRVRARW
jgi:uncharacterized SAM-dependent methyltransferase